MRTVSRLLDPATALAGMAIVLPTLSLLAPLGIAPLAAAAVLLVLLHHGIVAHRWPAPDPVLLLALGGFVAWAASTALWSLQPERSLLGALRVGAISLGGLVLLAAARDLDAGQRQHVGRAIAVGAALAALVFIAELASGIGFSRLFADVPDRDPIAVFNRAASVFAVLCWPLAIVVGRRWRAGGVACLLIIVALAMTRFDPKVPLLAFAAATTAFLLAVLWPRYIALALTAALLAFVLALPALPALAPRLDATLTAEGNTDTSLSHRLAIWGFSTKRSLERPFGGWGMATSRAIPGSHDNVLILGKPFGDAPAIPLHPHNAAVQIWLETGLPGLLIAVFVTVRALYRIPRAGGDQLGTAGALATATALLAIAHMSYGIWQGWWLCVVWLAAVLARALLSPPAPE